MNVLHFASPDGEVSVCGSEWMRLWNVLHDITVGMMDVPSGPGRKRMEELTGTGAPEANTVEHYAWIHGMQHRFMPGGFGPGITWQGRELSKLGIVVNTALAIGGDPVKLAARLIAQADGHGCWAEGEDRLWLAGIIDQGLKTGVLTARFRSYGDNGLWEPAGWEDVTALLRARSDQPVVAVYSGSGGFPPAIAPGQWRPGLDDNDEREDQWAELSSAERWQAGMADLRTRQPGARLDPATWETVRFDESVSVLDLLADDYANRLSKAVGAEQDGNR